MYKRYTGYMLECSNVQSHVHNHSTIKSILIYTSTSLHGQSWKIFKCSFHSHKITFLHDEASDLTSSDVVFGVMSPQDRRVWTTRLPNAECNKVHEQARMQRHVAVCNVGMKGNIFMMNTALKIGSVCKICSSQSSVMTPLQNNKTRTKLNKWLYRHA